jgi:hypothetical protein
MTRIPPSLFLVALGVLLLPARAPAAVTPQQVDDAVKRGVDYLWSQQKSDGRWEQDDHRETIGHDWRIGEGDSFGGFTALSVYALLAADAKKSDPRMLKAIDFLKHADITGNYALGLRCQVWLNLGNTAETRNLLAADVKRLLNGLGQKGETAGLWGYWSKRDEDSARIDHSVSQYGVLGLWAGTQLDVPVSPDDWKSIDAAWRKQQNPDGGWSYDGSGSDGSTSTASMTAAGIASLFITQDMLHGAMIVGSAQGNFSDPKIDIGLNWMSEHFDQVKTNYNWYGVERIGAASGFKYFGSVDWYTRGAETLVSAQKPAGQWESSVETGTPVSDTGLALLFMCHGRAPVMLNKLDYAVGGDGHVRDATWNARHRDAANLARFTSHNMEVLLNWQTVNLASPPEDWHDAPMLYISGSKAMDLTPYELSKLKLYVEQGGMIVANAEAVLSANPRAKAAFPDSIRAMGRRMFGRDFRPLPPTHPILADQSYRSSRWPGEPGIEGLSNGVRELMVLLTNDPAHAWQVDSFRTETPKFEIATDLLLYAVDKQDLRGKGETYLVHADAPVRRVMPVARLWVGANPDPEPGGWRRLNAVTINANGTALDLRYVKLGDGSLLRPVAPLPAVEPASQPATTPSTVPASATTAPARRPAPRPQPVHFRIAHLTGTTAFKLDAAQRKELADFTAAGGTLIVDAAGGSSEFADSAEAELAAIFGGSPQDIGTVLPPTHPLYRMPGATIAGFGWRLYARNRLGPLHGPLVRAIEEGDRATLFYSRQDLSAGMVGQSVDGIVGYSPATATAIMRNIVLYCAR